MDGEEDSPSTVEDVNEGAKGAEEDGETGGEEEESSKMEGLLPSRNVTLEPFRDPFRDTEARLLLGVPPGH